MNTLLCTLVLLHSALAASPDFDPFSECLARPDHSVPILHRAQAALKAHQGDLKDKHSVVERVLHEEGVKLYDRRYLTDLWGFPIPWKSRDEGWTKEKREDLFGKIVNNLLAPYYVPPLTDTGFQVGKIPSKVTKIVKNRINGPKVLEKVPINHGGYNEYYVDEKKNFGRHRRMHLTEWDDKRVGFDISRVMHPLLEEWSGIKLETNDYWVYGPRTYSTNASFQLHTDTIVSHVVSAILQLDQETEDPWPLTFIDNKGEQHLLFLKPGEMLMYESARCAHGRPFPLRGKSYTNLFVHFKPKKRWYESDPIMDVNEEAITKEDLLH